MSGFVKALLGVIAIVLLIGVLASLFTVEQRQQALVLQFGEPKRIIQEPGLFVKWPMIQEAIILDKRLLDYDAPAEEVIASDQKRLVVDAFARFRIEDPLKFYQTVRTENVLRPRLGAIINSNLRKVLGTVPLQDVISEDREMLMQRIAESVREEAMAFGIRVYDVRIKHADLPQANSEAVFRRMQTERQQEAAELRAKGAEKAQRIRAEADRERVVIVAEAERDGEILRGEGEGDSNRIFSEAFSRDPDFFAFYRSMQAYQKALGSGDTTMVLSPNSEFFRYFGKTETNAPREPR
ncbi:MAG: protease modulator HflC [Alphaproteobacteria bacterium]|nr:protease modulator HflC [Alphaproteobacteria bacterium]